MSAPQRQHPVVLVLPALFSLVFALVGGLVRLPWALPFGGGVAPFHGALMVSGFLGTVIAAERAAALGQPWAWTAVTANGLGALLLLVTAGTPLAGLTNLLQAGAVLFVAGAAGLVAIFAAILRREPRLFNAVMGLGTLFYLLGNVVLLAGRPVPEAVPAWSAFLVLTIAGERLELNRFLRPRQGAGVVFGLAVVLLVVGTLVALENSTGGGRVAGAALLVLASWLLVNDIARRTVRMSGLTRYTAVCLLTGYFWLALAGLSLLAFPAETVGPRYDANLHALFVGFVLSMIFGHAPVIVPALTGRAVYFHPRFYLALLLLHGSLLLRVAGDHAAWPAARRWGGLLNEAALLVFLAMMVVAVRQGNRPRAVEQA